MNIFKKQVSPVWAVIMFFALALFTSPQVKATERSRRPTETLVMLLGTEEGS